MSMPEPIATLVVRYAEVARATSDLGVARLCRDFVEPLLTALGGPASSRRGGDNAAASAAAAVAADVVLAAEFGGSGAAGPPRSRRVRYDVRVDGRRVCIADVPASATAIAGAAADAYQLRRCAWSAGVELAVLTNFEEFAVYDCRIKPSCEDSAVTARRFYCPYTEYGPRWAEIVALFAHPSNWPPIGERRGRAGTRRGRGRRRAMSVDASLLADLDSWRHALGQALVQNRSDPDQRDLRWMSHGIIERLLFVRICEDRGLEPYGQLRQLSARTNVYWAVERWFGNRYGAVQPREPTAAKGGATAEATQVAQAADAAQVADAARAVDAAQAADDARAVDAVQAADAAQAVDAVQAADATRAMDAVRAADAARAAQPARAAAAADPERTRLAVADQVLRAIIDDLYEPRSPYAFAQLPGEILGRVYEQSLSRGARWATQGGKGAAKPATRRASGIFYTPASVVQYLVAVTLGPLLAGKTPQQVHRLRIVDPACGAGSFLLGAYQYLLAWYERAYARSSTSGGQTYLARTESGAWQLTVQERLRILKTHCYGVDIDARAVEMTRLSLLLAALDGAAEAAGETSVAAEICPQRILADLHATIQCGNALVAADFVPAHGHQVTAAEMEQIRVFDWERCFPRVFAGAQPGFDVVLGNPPWGQKGIMELAPVKEYVRRRFVSVGGIYDLFRPFVEQGIRLLRRGHGRFGMVLPDIVLLKDYLDTRRYLLENLALTHIDWWGMAFSSAIIDVATIAGIKKQPSRRHRVCVAVREPGAAVRVEPAEPGSEPAEPGAEPAELGSAPAEFRSKPAEFGAAPAEFGFEPAGPGAEPAESGSESAAARAASGSEGIQTIPQSDFLANDRYVFNLLLTPDRRAAVQRLARYPRLRDLWEAHEGVHSGNIRSELFVDHELDGSCRPLYFGRDEIAPYHLRWNRAYIRLSVLPRKNSRARYANSGQPSWFARDKLLVRRTGDRVLAAVDRRGWYASNNFFVVLAREPGALDVDGLCALLNSRLITWYFRTIEPRKGRVFAELKIKHLSVFPLPDPRTHGLQCQEINQLGARRAELAGKVAEGRGSSSSVEPEGALTRQANALDGEIDRAVYALFDLSADEIEMIESGA